MLKFKDYNEKGEVGCFGELESKVDPICIYSNLSKMKTTLALAFNQLSIQGFSSDDNQPKFEPVATAFLNAK